MNEFILHRNKNNPIIKPENFPVPADSVMNCGQAYYKGKIVLLVAVIYRGLLNGQKTGIHVAMSDNGIDFDINPKPLCSHVDWANGVDYDCWVIDPRLTQIGDEYYIIRPGEGALGPCALLEKTTDFETTEFLGCIALPPNRVPCLFPEKIDDRYVKLDRPMNPTGGKGSGEIWLSYSPDLKYWGDYKPLFFPGAAPYFDFKIGPTVPVKTKDGWLELFHGTWDSCANTRYSIGAMLLDLDDPSKVIGYTRSWILTPQADYEHMGHVSNVCFPCGCLIDEKKDEINVYYGAADEYVCLASGSLSELIDACKKGL